MWRSTLGMLLNIQLGDIPVFAEDAFWKFTRLHSSAWLSASMISIPFLFFSSVSKLFIMCVIACLWLVSLQKHVQVGSFCSLISSVALFFSFLMSSTPPVFIWAISPHTFSSTIRAIAQATGPLPQVLHPLWLLQFDKPLWVQLIFPQFWVDPVQVKILHDSTDLEVQLLQSRHF